MALPFGALLRQHYADINPARLPSGFDRVGDIAIVGIVPELKPLEGAIGAMLLARHPHLRVAAKRAGEHHGPFRLRPLTVIAGEQRFTTQHRENGVLLHLDLGQVYFSVRSAHERARIAAQVRAGESVVVLGSGAGPLPLVIARQGKAREILGIDLNPAAHACALRSLAANRRFGGRVRFLQGDAAQVLPACRQRFDRVAIVLPHDGTRLLPCALQVLKPGGMLHFYAMRAAQHPETPELVAEQACQQLGLRPRSLLTVACGHCGPGLDRVCLDVRLDTTG
jgi:tRNA (guanine37-N1)-methyltransferase